MIPKLLTRLADALKDAWDHKWSQAAINERLSCPDGSGNRRLWSSRLWGPAHAARRRPDDDAAAHQAADLGGRPKRGRWSPQSINERLDVASRRRQR